MGNLEEPRYSVVIVDDDRFAREALVLLFTDPVMRIAGSFADMTDALAFIEQQAPHVAVVDIHIHANVQEKLAFIHGVRRASSATACLVLSAVDDNDELRYEVIEAGADGVYRLSDMTGEALLDIVKRLAQGQSDLSRGLASKLLQQLIEAESGKTSYRVPPVPDLTPVEREVLARRAQGEDKRRIADDLNVSLAGLGRHFRNILRKFFLPEAY